MGKHIIILTSNELTYDRRMNRIARALIEGGYSITMLGRRRTEDHSPYSDGIRRVRHRCLFNQGVLFYMELNLRHLWYILSHNSDAVIAVDTDTLPSASIGSMISRSYLIHDAHEYFVEVPELKNQRIKKWIWSKVEQLCIPHSVLNYTVNHSLANILSDRFKTHFHVIRNVPPITPEEFISRDEVGQHKIILYQGAVNEGRGLSIAIEAMAHLEDMELWIAGEGDLVMEKQSLARDLGVSDRVRFLGYVHPDELHDLTRRAWVGINLLNSDSLNYYYSLANKFFDYMHAGVPSINMQFPEYIHILNQFECGVMIEEYTLDCYLQAIEHLRIESVYNNCVEAAQKARVMYNWDSEKKRLLMLYEKVFKQN